MTIAEIKNDLHKLVVETNDLKILKAIQSVFNAMKKQTDDWWDLLSEKEKQLVKMSLKEADEGNLIPHSEARSKIDQWIESKS